MLVMIFFYVFVWAKKIYNEGYLTLGCTIESEVYLATFLNNLTTFN